MQEDQDNIFERHPKKTIFIIILVAVVVLDFSSAAVLKALGLFEPSYVPSEVLEATYRKQHPVFHHTLAANIDFSQAEWGRQYYTVRTNSLGFKDSKVRDINLMPAKKRILLIGDSFTEGVGIEFKDTFAGILQQTLNHDMEILNAAATSYSPIIYLRKTKYLIEDAGLNFDHLVVFIDLSDIEDEARGYTFDNHGNVISRQSIGLIGHTTKDKTLENKPQMEEAGFKEFMTRNTILLGRVRNLAGWLRNTLRPWDRSLNQRRAMWTLDESIYNDYAKQGLALAEQHMSRLKLLLDEQQIELTLVIYPWPDQIYQTDLNSKHVAYWQTWARQHHVNFVNLFPSFIKTADSPEDIIKTYFIAGDVHWNKLGHRKVADILLQLEPFKSR
ncbi:MAG: hypothetical protein PVG75_08455 [Thioalkalispiraceae bacterium]|jgi:hypothetical protein